MRYHFATPKINIIYILGGFSLFALGWYFGYSMQEDYALPKVISIRRDGNLIAYAKANIEESKVVNLPNVEDPGAYLAFPLYADKNHADRLLQ